MTARVVGNTCRVTQNASGVGDQKVGNSRQSVRKRQCEVRGYHTRALQSHIVRVVRVAEPHGVSIAHMHGAVDVKLRIWSNCPDAHPIISRVDKESVGVYHKVGRRGESSTDRQRTKFGLWCGRIVKKTLRKIRKGDLPSIGISVVDDENVIIRRRRDSS